MPDKEKESSAVESDGGAEDDEEESSETRSLTAATGGPHASSAWAGRTVTLQMLLSTGILKPEKSSMAIEYMGQKFMGDLLPDGKIKSVETEAVFCSPSAWAISCKRIINPEKKSGSGWASVKYKGKKLDYYKQLYLRKMQSQKECSPSDDEPDVRDVKETSPPPPIRRHILTHNTINNRHITHDANSLLEAVTFATLGKLQPFHMSVSTSALLLMDLHAHLTKTEVSGYLGGAWDTNTHNLTITHSFPCRNSQWDREKGADVELAIKKAMAKQNLSLVGWYHSHPRSPAQPTLRDIDAQLEYQIKMRGPSEATYSPCIGMICSPYYQPAEPRETGNANGLESSLVAYWVVPPSENKPHEYGRPMMMTYAVQQDKEVSAEVMEELRATLAYYRQLSHPVLLKWADPFRTGLSYVDKVKASLYPKFAQRTDAHQFWNVIREGLGLEPEEHFEAPDVEQSAILALIKREQQQQPTATAAGTSVKEESGKGDANPTPLSQISSLQEQLNMPSGLNMNPILFSQTGEQQQQSAAEENHVNSSPITIPSNSASPAKFEVPPVRMSPSPAKSDTTVSTVSSSRARNSPAPSPNRRAMAEEFRASPSITSIPGLTITPSSSRGGSAKGGSGGGGGLSLEKIEAMMGASQEGLKSTSTVSYEGGSAAAAAQNMNELFSASLASLSKTLPPGLLTQHGGGGGGGGSGSAVDYQNLFGSPQGSGGGGGGAGGRGERERERSTGSNKSSAGASEGNNNYSGREGAANKGNSSSSSSAAAAAAAAQLAKEKFTIEQLMQSPVVPPHLKELLSQIDQNDLNFILAHPMFNNPEFLNALMPKERAERSGGSGGERSRESSSGGGARGERERESSQGGAANAAESNNNRSSSNSSRSSGGGGGGSSRTSGAGKQSSSYGGGGGGGGDGRGSSSSTTSGGGERGGGGSSNSNSKEPKGYYDTHQLPSSLLAQAQSMAAMASGNSGGGGGQNQKGGKSSSSSASNNAAAAAAAAQNMMMMSQYEEANKQLAELMKSPEYAMLMQQTNAMYGGMPGFDPAAMLASHFTGPVPQPPAQQQQQHGGGSGGGSSKRGGSSKGKQQQQQQQAAQQQQQQQQQQAAAAAAAAMSAMGLPPMPSLAELNSLLQATQKMPELSSLFGAKPSEINAMIQQQMAQQMMREAEMQQVAAQQAVQGGGGGGGGRRGRGSNNSNSNNQSESNESRKQQQQLQQQMQQQQQEINALFGSKLPDLTTITPIAGGQGQAGGGGGGSSANAAMAAALAAGLPPEFASLFAAQQQQQQQQQGGGGSGSGNNKKSSDNNPPQQQQQQQLSVPPMMAPNNDMLATLLQIGKSQDLSQLLFPPGGGQPTAKQLADLNAFFSHPPPGLGIGKGGGDGRGSSSSAAATAAAVSAAQDAMSLYPNISVSAAAEGRGGGGGGEGGSRKQQQQQQQQQAQAVQQAQLLQFQQEQQELANLYQQQILKYPGIPDPLSKSTLAANNLYMTPSAALMKMQQEALNSIMMKPPKASGGGGGGGGGERGSGGGAGTALQQSLMASHLMGVGGAGMTIPAPPLSHSPLSERLLSTTPTKSNSSASSSRGNSPQVVNNPPVQQQQQQQQMPKSYGFSVADLAISSVSAAAAAARTMTPSPKSTTSSSCYGGGGGTSVGGVADLSRKSMSPANLAAFGESVGAPPPPIKKRMEFSSIADLVAPPPAKVPKFEEGGMLMNMRMPSVSPALSSTGSLTGSLTGREPHQQQQQHQMEGETGSGGGGGALNLSGCD